MTHTIGRNVNHNNESVITVVPVNVDVAVTLSGPNFRHWMSVTCIDEAGWLRFLPAATDPTIRKGIRFLPMQTIIFPVDDLYRGEISCMNDKDGKSPIFHITEMVGH